jgi:hypothetical protein
MGPGTVMWNQGREGERGKKRSEMDENELRVVKAE